MKTDRIYKIKLKIRMEKPCFFKLKNEIDFFCCYNFLTLFNLFFFLKQNLSNNFNKR